jgi:hypothetical protein
MKCKIAYLCCRRHGLTTVALLFEAPSVTAHVQLANKHGLGLATREKRWGVTEGYPCAGEGTYGRTTWIHYICAPMVNFIKFFTLSIIVVCLLVKRAE